MLIIYDKTTGQVVENTGTSSSWPEGPPDELAWVNVDAAGKDRTNLRLLRLHDTDAAQVINQMRTNLYHVDPTTKQVVIDAQRPDPAPTSTPPTIDERLTALVNLLETKGVVSKQEVNAIRAERVRPAPPR